MDTNLNKYSRKKIEDLKDGEGIKQTFAVREKNTPRNYKNKPGLFFEITLGDNSGEIRANYWGGNDKEKVLEIYNKFHVGDVIEVSGIVGSYQKNRKIDINEGNVIRKCEPFEFECSDFLPKSKKNIEVMLSEILEIKESIENEFFIALLNEFFNDSDFLKKFKEMPASMHNHHNFIGGYLEHIHGVLKICNSICEIYTDLNKDLLLTCAILHDSGKIHEYKYQTSIDYTDEGSLIGHIVLCDRVVKERIDKVEGFPKDLERKVSHMILSHHGKNEWGSPIEPRIPEALALHHADNMDAKLKGILQIIDENKDIDEDVIKDFRYGYIYMK